MVAMQMMMKLMLIPLLAGMLLGNSPKFQSRSCCSQVFTGYSLSIMNSISLARKKKHHVPGSGMLQTWLRCPLPWGAHLDTCTHHIWETGSTALGSDSSLCTDLPYYLMLYYNCVFIRLLHKRWPSTEARTIFFISVFQSLVIVPSRCM